ncbi:chorismate mutase, partial [Bacillus sp. WP8]|uniref:chorismate mutase n=1 Tax=Bacillus sp. WP8 TaxID=756828 RepID=UPI001C92C334
GEEGEERMRKMRKNEVEKLREEGDEVNVEMLKVMNERGKIVKEIGKGKEGEGVKGYDGVREGRMVKEIVEENDGGFEK